MRFADVIGHKKIKAKLCSLVHQQSVPQTQLFSGPAGSAVLPLALSWASYLLCSERKELDTCGECSHCQKTNKHLHPDLFFSFPLPLSANTSPTQAYTSWRSFLLENPYQELDQWADHLGKKTKQMKISTSQIEETIAFLRTHAIQGRTKIILFWLPEEIHTPAAHKLLKTLEEPPAHLYFIFVSHHRDAILPTISSRILPLCNVPPFTEEELVQLLKKRNPDLPDNTYKRAAAQANGNANLALQLIRNEEKAFYEPLSTWLRGIYAQNWANVTQQAELFERYTPNQQKEWVTYALKMMHATLIEKAHTAQRIRWSQEEATFAQKLSKTISMNTLTGIISSIEAMYPKLARHAHSKLLFLYTSFSIATLFAKEKES